MNHQSHEICQVTSSPCSIPKYCSSISATSPSDGNHFKAWWETLLLSWSGCCFCTISSLFENANQRWDANWSSFSFITMETSCLFNRVQYHPSLYEYDMNSKHCLHWFFTFEPRITIHEQQYDINSALKCSSIICNSASGEFIKLLSATQIIQQTKTENKTVQDMLLPFFKKSQNARQASIW